MWPVVRYLCVSLYMIVFMVAKKLTSSFHICTSYIYCDDYITASSAYALLKFFVSIVCVF